MIYFFISATLKTIYFNRKPINLGRFYGRCLAPSTFADSVIPKPPGRDLYTNSSRSNTTVSFRIQLRSGVIAHFCLKMILSSLWFCSWQVSLALGVRLVRQSPTSTGDNSFMMSHNVYVDSRLRHNAFNVLNHQDWRVRFVVAEPVGNPIISSKSIVPVSPKNTPLCQSVSPIEPSTSTTSTKLASNLTTIKPMTSLPKTNDPSRLLLADTALNDDSSYWNTRTETACIARLGSSNVTASNPSGKAVCYNVRELSNVTGAFLADVRLYATSEPIMTWKNMQSTGLTIGLSYVAASVRLEDIRNHKRSGVTPYSLSSRGGFQDEQHTKRSGVERPQILEILTFSGQIFHDSISDLQQE